MEQPQGGAEPDTGAAEVEQPLGGAEQVTAAAEWAGEESNLL